MAREQHGAGWCMRASARCALATLLLAAWLPGPWVGSAQAQGIPLTEEQKLTASDAAAGDRFGHSVSFSGDRAIVGAHLNSDAGTASGSAYVYERAGDGTWTEVAKLTASDAAQGQQFGYSVSIVGDRAIVGAFLDDDGGAQSGSAYVYERDGGGMWTEVTKLTASDAAVDDLFGASVSIAGDRAIVGAVQDDDGGPQSGSAYVYERAAGGTWTEVAKLTGSDAADGDRFGISVSIAGDQAIVGALRNGDGGSDSGSAYVYERDGGGTWTEAAKLIASDAAASDVFGSSVSIAGDRAIVGAYGNDDVGTDSGSAYVYERDGGGTWTEVAKLTGSDAADGDRFGISVSIAGDRAIVGAFFDDDKGNDSGSAYVYEQDGGGAWMEVAKLTGSDAANGDRFGLSVSIAGDRVIVGSYLDDDGGLQSGSAYTFDLAALIDGDGDGVADVGDNCPEDVNPLQEDFDEDLLGDACDLDDDDDGTDDTVDAFPLDPNETSDTDGDGIGNNADLDDDGDGQSDAAETACSSDPLDAGSTSPDTDGDGVPDCLDNDRDGDGVADESDAFPDDPAESIDTDGDGVGNNADLDDDNDTQLDADESACGSDPLDADSTSADADGDGTLDCLDDDRDGDGVENAADAFPDDPTESVDTDNDGIGNNADTDDDNDGVDDSADPFPLDPTRPGRGGLPPLVVGSVETDKYGFRFEGIDSHREVLERSFEASSTDLVLTLTGYDIDISEEVRVLVNGTPIGFFSRTSNNGRGNTRLPIPQGLLLGTGNTLRFEQRNPGWIWGVTELLLSESGGGTGGGGLPPLVLGSVDQGEYGFRFEDVNSHREALERSFEASGTDLVLTLSGYDIDIANEVRVLVNGTPIGFLSRTPNNGRGTTRLTIAQGLLLGTGNTLRFEQRNPGWKWGVTELLLSESGGGGGGLPPLVLDSVDPNRYGFRFEGVNSHREALERSFEASGTDLVLTLSGYDIDIANEVRVLVNGTPIGFLSRTPNNGGDIMQLTIAQGLLLGTGNTLRFEQRNPGWIWGVTELLLSGSGGGM